MKQLFEEYKMLAEAFGPSGREQEIRETIMELAKPYADEISTDALGNLICRKKGEGKKVLLAAHMDSIGIAVTFIDENGFLRFSPVGGLFRGDLIDRAVRFQNGTRGVISFEEKTPFRDLTMDQLFLDIGVSSREEAEKLVQVGDFAVFDAPAFLQGGALCGPYIDNRIGCLTLLRVMRQCKKTKNDLYFVFTVQEEVGLRGAGAAAFGIDPDIALAVDVTDTGDLPERKTPMAVKMGKGPAVKVMDRSVICAPEICRALEQAAEKCEISVQQEIMPMGGTDTSVLQKTRGGVKSGAVSIPARYIHSPCEMCAASDVLQAVEVLAEAVMGKL